MAPQTPAASGLFHSLEKLPLYSRLAWSAGTGALVSLSFTGWSIGLVVWIVPAGLILLSLASRSRAAFGCGFFHGFAFVLTSLYWIAAVLAVHGGLSSAEGAAILVLIAAAWGVLTGLFAWCVKRAARISVFAAFVMAPFFWVAMEFARTHLPEIGFPWNLIGYAAAQNLGLVQITTVTGIFGLSFVVLAFNAAIAIAIHSDSRKRLAIAAVFGAALALTAGVGPFFLPVAYSAHVARAVQPNFPESEVYPADWYAENAASLADLERISLAPSRAPADLLLWPEVPTPFSFQDSRFAILASRIAVNFQHPFLAGAAEWKVDPSATGEARGRLAPFNSAILIDAHGQRVFSYDKMHLVPFGEYEPFPLIHRVVRSLSSEVGGFRPGYERRIGALPGGHRFGAFICYESIFPGEIRRFAAGGAELLINLSNDGWFGRSAAAEQHLRMARVRTVENRRWLLRATNNGYTVSVDPYGRIVKRIPPDQRLAADLPYDFRTETTFYTRFGDWFAWLCVLISAILLALSFRAERIIR